MATQNVSNSLNLTFELACDVCNIFRKPHSYLVRHALLDPAEIYYGNLTISELCFCQERSVEPNAAIVIYKIRSVGLIMADVDNIGIDICKSFHFCAVK